MNKLLHEFTVKVRADKGADLPAGSRGAFVPCYAFAPDHQAAVKAAVKALSSQHLVFEAMDGGVRELPLARWAGYLSQVWPEFVDEFPSEARMAELQATGGVFFGPMTTF
ncbi:MAG TPA: hypothetical protein H9903_00290 [Candidatus Aquabacterium excrementipullorum]|nr:hypothetical protein [Candidatus Aquabacterium excrementipullorum]